MTSVTLWLQPGRENGSSNEARSRCAGSRPFQAIHAKSRMWSEWREWKRLFSPATEIKDFADQAIFAFLKQRDGQSRLLSPSARASDILLG